MLTCNKIVSEKDSLFIFQFHEKVTSRTNSGHGALHPSLPYLGRNQEECFAPFGLQHQKKQKQMFKQRKCIASGAPSFRSRHFLD